jgi:hypothetical protein
MIPIECPKCGRTYTVPPDRLSAKFHCKACDSNFYMDTGGRLVLGDPNKKTKGKSYQPTSFEMGKIPEQYKELAKKALPFLAAAVVIWFAGKWVMNLRGAGPQKLEDYGMIFGKAVLEKNSGPLSSYATPDTYSDATALLDKIREALKPDANAENTQLVSAEVAQQEKTAAGYRAVQVLFIPDLSADTSSSKKLVAKPYGVYFQLKENAGAFRLDIKKTIERMASEAAK